jgi:hydroxymethylpyrimidine/phosphomethylpyrimidine kinase
MKRIDNVISIAGLDPSAGAGVYADLRTFSSLGLWGMGVVTSHTVQGPRFFKSVYPVPAVFFKESLFSVLEQNRNSAIKIGLVTEEYQIMVLAECIEKYSPSLVVLDTIIKSSTGRVFWNDKIIKILLDVLLPKVDVVTPNVKEAITLGNVMGVPMPRPYNDADLYQFVEDMQQKLRCSIAMTGGDIDINGRIFDLYYDGTALYHRKAKRLEVEPSLTHGTGCTFSSALLAYMVKGLSFIEACKSAAAFVERSIKGAVYYSEADGGLDQLGQYYG